MSTLPYDRPSDPAKRHSAALTDGPDRAGARAMLKAVGFTDEDLAKPHRRRGHDLDRDDALQPQPAPPGGARQGGHPRRGRHAHGVQHRRRLRRRVDGHRGHEGLARQPRGRGRLDRARGARPPLRRPRRASSAATRPTPARPWPSARLDIPSVVLYNGTIYPGTYKGQPQDVVSVYEAIGAYRAGKIEPRGALRDRVGRLPGRRRLRRPVHGQHDEHGASSSWGSRRPA